MGPRAVRREKAVHHNGKRGPAKLDGAPLRCTARGQRYRSPDRSPAGAPQIKAGPRKKRGPGKLDQGPVSVPRAGPIIEEPAPFPVRGPASWGAGRGVKFVPRPAPLRTLTSTNNSKAYYEANNC